jgi:hypothetical protein
MNFPAMATEKETTKYSGKIVQYSGGEEKWREWSVKKNAYVGTREWHKALLQDCEHAAMSEVSLTSEETSDQVLNHLIMACQDLAFNAYDCWLALIENIIRTTLTC